MIANLLFLVCEYFLFHADPDRAHFLEERDRILYIWSHCGIISNNPERDLSMEKKQFSDIRRRLGKTQLQMAQLLGISLKAIQSFEQGWRNILVHIERQVLFLLAAKRSPSQKETPCWVIRKCPAETKQNCPDGNFR
jgi:DNA-binding XRE family transcriptional regulator